MIRIGVTGHRSLVDVDRLTEGVDRALEHIAQTFPDQPMTIYSPLAEGGDRFVVKRAVEKYNARVVVPLPLAVEEYKKDFSSEISKNEFEHLLAAADQVVQLPTQSTREQAYLAAGLYVLDHCDVLIALWDGQKARGKGGVGDIVAEAQHRKLSILWVQAVNGLAANNATSTHIVSGAVRRQNI